MQPALLVIDVQQQFYRPAAAASLDSAITQINAAIALFRAQRCPIIAIQNVNPAEGLVPGAAGFALIAALDIQPADVHIHKAYSNAFNKTPLAGELYQRGVDTVIVTGYSAAYCVLSTYRGAQDLDLDARVLVGAIASPVARYIPFVEEITKTITLDALQAALA